MNLPFEKEREKWEPRKRIGLDDSLTPVEREILDSIDVLEQKGDYGIKLSVRAFNISLVAAVVVAVTQGPAFIKVIKSIFGVS
jgi:hypothetical protein